jgi:hypothetical protein
MIDAEKYEKEPPEGRRRLVGLSQRQSEQDCLQVWQVTVQIRKGNKGHDVEMVDIHGARRDMSSHRLESIETEELVLESLWKDIRVLLHERDYDGLVVLLQVFLINM